MAASVSKNAIKFEGPDLYEIREEFKKLPKNIAARVMGAGLRRAMAPAVAALKKVTPAGPTGNLRRAIKTIVKRYPKNGAAAAVAGYQKAGTGKSKSAAGGTVKKGSDRAFHQFWLEFGTRERFTTGSIASSWKRLGKFKIKGNARAAKRSRKAQIQPGAASRVQTTPGYPKAFFKKSKDRVRLPAVLAQYPVRTAFAMSKAAIAGNLNREMRAALENGRKILEDQVRRRAAMRDLGRHL